MKRILLCILTFFPVVAIIPTHGAETDIQFDHASWTEVLEKFVDAKGLVDYQALHRDRAIFDKYVQTIEENGPNTSPKQFPDQQHQLAYYINAYNALTFKGVLNRGPESESVWKGLISGLNFFVRMKIKVDGKTTNLKKLEDKIIRKQFKDPRIHAALVCASISCPRLIQQAYLPETLDSQLDQVTQEFVSSDSHVLVNEEQKTVTISAIFDWFDKDFLNDEKQLGNKSPNLIDYINRYRSKSEQIDRNFKIRFFEYNKGINSQ